MNTKSALLLTLTLAAGIGLNAQTNTPAPPTIGDTLSLAASWAGNINTNYHYQDAILWDGPIYINQVNVANELGGSYDFWRSNTNALVTTNGVLAAALEGRFRQAGVATTWLSEQGGAEFAYQKCSFRAGIFLDGVYRNDPKALGITSKARLGLEGGVFADQMLSKSSALGLFISGQSGLKYPIIGANLNISFGNGGGFLGLFRAPPSN